MVTQSHQPVTELLAAVGQGDPDAHEKLWVAVYTSYDGYRVPELTLCV